MYVFLDESGDAGFKFEGGSSAQFVIALVIFDDPLDAEETALAIKRLRQRLNMNEKYEFKFSKTDDYRRLQFLEAVKDCDFRVRVMVVDKRTLQNQTLRTDKESFYNYFVGQLFAHNSGSILGARLRVDGSGGREFKQAFQTYLRGKLTPGTILKCKFVNSANDNLIQLADMVAGAVYRSYNPNKQDSSYLERIRHRIEDFWELK